MFKFFGYGIAAIAFLFSGFTLGGSSSQKKIEDQKEQIAQCESSNTQLQKSISHLDELLTKNGSSSNNQISALKEQLLSTQSQLISIKKTQAYTVSDVAMSGIAGSIGTLFLAFGGMTFYRRRRSTVTPEPILLEQHKDPETIVNLKAVNQNNDHHL